MEEFDLAKSFDELLKPIDPPQGAPLKHTTEAPDLISLALAALAAGGTSLAQWPQSLLPTGAQP